MPDFLASEKAEPRYQAHQHWIMLILRRPAKHWAVLLVVLAVAGVVWPWPMGLAFLSVAVLLAFGRWRLWMSERIWLTCKRIIHVQGVLETSRTEAWLRIDRISGMRVNETLLGAWLGYATIHIDAPGDHPGTHKLFRIGKALPFYERFRYLVLEGHSRGGDPEFGEQTEYITEELPDLSDGTRFRRRG